MARLDVPGADVRPEPSHLRSRTEEQVTVLIRRIRDLWPCEFQKYNLSEFLNELLKSMPLNIIYKNLHLV